MRETTIPTDTPREQERRNEQERRKLRSTGDSRVVPGGRQPKQTTQPSLGDPENAPGAPATTPETKRG